MGRGVVPWGKALPHLPTPTPNPSPSEVGLNRLSHYKVIKVG